MKTILLPFFDDAASVSALEAAYRFASRRNAHIEGLFVTRPPQMIDGEGIAVMAPYVTQLKEEGEEQAQRARERFAECMAEKGVDVTELGEDTSGVSASWMEVEDLATRVVGAHGRLFDLVVVGRGFGAPLTDWSAISEAALFETGRPILIVDEQVPEAIGRKVVIAWNQSTETARTVAFSMPLLVEAEEVTVLSVEGWGVPGPDGDALARHLRRNGVTTRTEHINPASLSPGEALLEHVNGAGTDLLVKGAYTQSRLRQLIFGGATQHILKSASVPVFMTH
jgi:nucleotide-binding universal stress UspA family protein